MIEFAQHVANRVIVDTMIHNVYLRLIANLESVLGSLEVRVGLSVKVFF